MKAFQNKSDYFKDYPSPNWRQGIDFSAGVTWDHPWIS